MHNPSVLILTPDLSVDGGVTNYYRTLGMDVSNGVQYFTVSDRAGRSTLVRVLKLAIIYFRFAWVSRKYALIHVNPTFDSRSYYRDMVFVLIALINRKRILVFFRGWDNSLEARVRQSVWLNRLFLRTYGAADRFCVLGKVFAAKLRALGVPEEVPVDIVTTVADSSRIATLRLEEKFNSYRDEVAVLFLSRITKTKGIYAAIDSFERCREMLPQKAMKLYIAGEGQERLTAERYVRKNGWTDVEFLGEVRGDSKLDLLEKCHVMLLPSSANEGLPNAILEGMLYGLAILSTPVAAIPEHVSSGINGFLVQDADTKLLAKHLLELARNIELYKNISATNHSKASIAYSTARVKRDLLDIYEATLQGESC